MKVAIIGSGLLGVTTAWYLSQGGVEVTVIDRQPGPAMETSYGNAGILHASHAEPWNKPGITKDILTMLFKPDAALVIQPRMLPQILGWGLRFLQNSALHYYKENVKNNALLSLYSLEMMQTIRSELQFDYKQSELGSITIFNDSAALQRSFEYYSHLDAGLIQAQQLSIDELLDMEPTLSAIRSRITGALYFPQDESGNPVVFSEALVQHAVEKGVKFMFDTQVDTLRVENGKITRICTNKDDVSADTVVLAAGSYSPLLAATCGLKLPIQPIKGYSITVPFNHKDNRPRYPVIDDYSHAGITPIGDQLRMTSTAEICGYDTSINKHRIDKLVNLAKELFPQQFEQLDESRVKHWTGFRPYCCDGVPIIGGTSVKNLYLNTGHGHLGWTMAAGSGRLLADMLLGNKTQLDMAPFSLARF